MLRLVSMSSFTISCDTIVSCGNSFITGFFTLCMLWPPMPTYTCAISVLRVFFSLFTILLSPCAVRSILYATPLRMYWVESSFATARIEMLPSGFFLPAIPVILDDPSSIATIKSFAIRLSC